MARRNKAKKREISPDSRYGSVLLMRFINTIMKCGKKSTAEKIIYDALSLAEKKIGEGVFYFQVVLPLSVLTCGEAVCDKTYILVVFIVVIFIFGLIFTL